MKKILVLLLLTLSFFLVTPRQVEALEVKEINENSLINFHSVIKNNTLLLDVEEEENVDEWMNDYNQEQNCSNDDSLLGNPNDPDSVAWLLQKILNYTRVIGPILVVILSSIEFAKVIIQSDDEAMGKAQKKLINRLILVAALFFVPTLVELILQIFGITGDPTCGIK